MHKIIIFGNSGSGKSTLAKKICDRYQLVHLDLDTLAWLATTPVQRKPLAESAAQITNFTEQHQNWLIEGCYSDLIEGVLPAATEIIFMNLSVAACVENAKNRPWEPHKYPSKQAQDENLTMLVDWIEQYSVRDDAFSAKAHQTIYANYPGKKTMITENGEYL